MSVELRRQRQAHAAPCLQIGNLLVGERLDGTCLKSRIGLLRLRQRSGRRQSEGNQDKKQATSHLCFSLLSDLKLGLVGPSHRYIGPPFSPSSPAWQARPCGRAGRPASCCCSDPSSGSSASSFPSSAPAASAPAAFVRGSFARPRRRS